MTVGAPDRERTAKVVPQLRVVRTEVVEARRATRSRRRKVALAILEIALGLAIGVAIAFARSGETRDPEQAWFWKKDWLAGELSVSNELQNRPPRYMSEDEFLAELDRVETQGT